MKKIKGFLLFLSCVLLIGCGKKEEQQTENYKIYMVQKDGNFIREEEVSYDTMPEKEMLQELFYLLQVQPADVEYKSAIPENIKLESYSLADNRLTLHFDNSYKSLSQTDEVLARAAIVRTLCQLESVKYVAFTVNNESLLNLSGVPVGYMTSDQFLDNAGNEMNAYEKVTLTLYFAGRGGEKLQSEIKEVIYNSNISMDKLVVEQLIEGPKEENDELGFATIPPTTEIISVTTRDGVCYVNLNDAFLSKQGNVTPEVAIYSIVNSLIELPSINKVQISVNGNNSMMYMETISLQQIFERNLEIIDNAQ